MFKVLDPSKMLSFYYDPLPIDNSGMIESSLVVLVDLNYYCSRSILYKVVWGD